MDTLLILAGRNIKLYLRDRQSVFFSLLSAFIIIMIYALFLGNNMVESIARESGSARYASWFVDAWLMAGVIVINSITISLGILGLMIKDKVDNRLRSFLIAPVSRATIVSAYLVAAWIIGSAMTLLTFVLGEAYIVFNGGELLSLIGMLQVSGLIILNVFSNTSIIFCVVLLMKTEGAYQAISTVMGTLIGFVTGIYVPIGFLSNAIQTFTKLLPATYGVALMRQVFVHEPLTQMFAGAPQEAVTGFEKYFGAQVFIGSYQCPPLLMILILLISGLAFIGLSVLIVNRKK